MKNFAFIFARGGSKGLPKKNIMELNGKPLIEYSIELAKKSPRIDDVFVSTDDIAIEEISKKSGANIIKRPRELAQDNSPEWLAWQHGILHVLKNYDEFDTFISIPATSPFRSVQDIDNGIETFLANIKADMCISLTESSRNPYFNMVRKDKDNFCKIICSNDNNFFRRQDAPNIFDITTVAYIANPSYIINNTGIFDGNVVGYEVPKIRALDIDSIYDFKYAQFLINEGLVDA